jgi:ureidoacrylate peracid hydrolase
MHKITVDPASLNLWRQIEGVTSAERPTRYSLAPARTALVVIDMQNGFCQPQYAGYFAQNVSIIPNINRLARAMREAGGKVVWIQQTFREDEPRFRIPAWRREAFPQFQDRLQTTFERGASAYELHADLDVREGDLRIEKTRWGAMMPNSSELHETLQAAGIDTLIATGCASDGCVESTVREATMLDYKPIFVMDATATDSDESHNATIHTLNHIFLVDLVMTDTLVEQLKASQREMA